MTRLLAVVVLVACSGRGPTKTTHPEPQEHGSGTPDTVSVVEARTDAQCAKLVAHALSLGTAERPPEHAPTDAERATIESQLREAWTPKCQEMTTASYDCAIAASSLAALEACAR